MQHDAYTADALQGSLLNSIVPKFISRRLSSVSHLAGIVRPSLSRRSTSIDSIPTPPPPYSEEPPTDDEDDMDYISAPSSRPSTSGSSTPTPPARSMVQAQLLPEDMVRYKFANHGLMLVAQSAHEQRTSQQLNDDYQRRLYLDGLVYLLRGLPEGLSEAERMHLREALPEPLREKLDITREEPGPSRTRSTLQTIISAVVFWLFLAFAFILPHIKVAARRAYAFERKHRLGEHFLQQALALAHITYSQLMALLCRIWTMNDGIVGRTLSEIGLWCAQNVSDGIRDGLKEAAAALQRNE